MNWLIRRVLYFGRKSDKPKGSYSLPECQPPLPKADYNEFGLFPIEIDRISKLLKKMDIPNEIVKYPVNYHPFKPFGSSTCETYTEENFWTKAKKADYIHLHSIVRECNKNYIRAGLCYKGDQMSFSNEKSQTMYDPLPKSDQSTTPMPPCKPPRKSKKEIALERIQYLKNHLPEVRDSIQTHALDMAESSILVGKPLGLCLAHFDNLERICSEIEKAIENI